MFSQKNFKDITRVKCAFWEQNPEEDDCRGVINKILKKSQCETWFTTTSMWYQILSVSLFHKE
jgi:hypothetical protein